MTRKEITTKEDLMKIIELFESIGITYWLDGGEWIVEQEDRQDLVEILILILMKNLQRNY